MRTIIIFLLLLLPFIVYSQAKHEFIKWKSVNNCDIYYYYCNGKGCTHLPMIGVKVSNNNKDKETLLFDFEVNYYEQTTGQLLYNTGVCEIQVSGGCSQTMGRCLEIDANYEKTPHMCELVLLKDNISGKWENQAYKINTPLLKINNNYYINKTDSILALNINECDKFQIIDKLSMELRENGQGSEKEKSEGWNYINIIWSEQKEKCDKEKEKKNKPDIIGTWEFTIKITDHSSDFPGFNASDKINTTFSMTIKINDDNTYEYIPDFGNYYIHIYKKWSLNETNLILEESGYMNVDGRIEGQGNYTCKVDNGKISGSGKYTTRTKGNYKFIQTWEVSAVKKL